MFKLRDKYGKDVFIGGYDIEGESYTLEDNSQYSFNISNNRHCMGDITVELYLDDVLCKRVDVLEGKCGCLAFKTGISSTVKIEVYPKYEVPICLP